MRGHEERESVLVLAWGLKSNGRWVAQGWVGEELPLFVLSRRVGNGGRVDVIQYYIQKIDLQFLHLFLENSFVPTR